MNVFDYFFEESKNLEKDFVIGNSETISYKELYENSLKIACYLIENFGTNKNIVLLSQNSVYFITAYLGILKSGNTCIPLDFSIEQNNLDYISSDTESSIIFCSKKVKSKLNLTKFSNVIDEDEFDQILEAQKAQTVDDNCNSQNIAELIFTSGSTGKPKGVMISHQNIISNTDSIIEYLRLTSEDSVLVVLPFYYCFGLSLFHTHLRVGGQIVLNNTFMFLSTVVNDLRTFECTGFSGVPSHYQMLLKKSKTFKEVPLPSLRYVSQAGGKLHNVFIEEFVDNFSEIEFFVMYGQTEATARLSYLPPDYVIKKMGSIGKAIPGVELKIFDSNDNEVKIGQVGEIVAKGGNIMMGYYNDVEGTNSTLKNGWLHTGDLAKMDEDGYFYIVAREKEIIKVGGQRVSPKEIEEVILSVSGIVDCSIHAVYDDLLGEAIKATIVIENEGIQDEIEKEILNQCRRKLAIHKIPQQFDFKNTLKLKSTGKK